MRRKLISTIIVLTLCLTSAFAASPNHVIDKGNANTNTITLSKVDETKLDSPQIVFSEAKKINTQIIPDATDNSETTANDVATQDAKATITPDFLVNDITVKPLILCEEDRGLYTIEGVYRRAHRWADNQPRFERLYLSPEETAEFYLDIVNAIEQLSTQNNQTYSFIGWDFSTQLYVQAQSPKEIKWTPSAECITGTEQRVLNIPYQNTNVDIKEYFQITSDDLNILKPLGIRGAFYFTYLTGPNVGKTGSLMISSGFTTNWT